MVKKKDLDVILGINELIAGDEFENELNRKCDVYFALGWRPGNASSIHIQSINIDGASKVSPGGDFDDDSPFQCKLGQQTLGKSVKVSWKIRSYCDLQGIRAFIKFGNNGKWNVLDTKIPLNDKEIWIGEKEISVQK